MGPATDEAESALSDPRAEPTEKFLAVAAKAEPGHFKPTPVHEKLAEHLFSSQATTFLDLAEAAGVSRTTIWRTLQDPKACQYIVSRASQAVEFGLGAVHARLLQMALTSRSPAFIRLYMERFDPSYAKVDAGGGTTINSKYTMIQSMSPAELEAFIRIQRRKEGIDNENKPAATVPPNQI